MVVTLKNDAGLQKQAKVGFSWTTLFFSFFVPLLRGDFKWAILMFLVEVFISIGLVIPIFILSFLVHLVFPFIYNRKYIEGLLENGYKPANEESKKMLQRKGIIG